MEEIWVPITSSDKKTNDGRWLYEVSNLGRIRSVAHTGENFRSYPMRILKQHIINGGGYGVNLLDSRGRRRDMPTNRLVAIAFVDNPLKYKGVRNKDGDQTNNRADNIEWYDLTEYRRKALAEARKLKSEDVKKHLDKPIRQYKLNGTYVKGFASIKEVASGAGVLPIISCCKREVKSVDGYVWRFVEDDEFGGPPKPTRKKKWEPIKLASCMDSTGSPMYEINRQGVVRPVDISGESYNFALKNGRRCVQLVTAKWTKRIYFVDTLVRETFGVESEERANAITEHNAAPERQSVTKSAGSSVTKSSRGSVKRHVRQYSLTGEFIKEYESATYAARVTGMARVNIVNSCIGKNIRCGSSVWRYADSDNLHGKNAEELKELVPGVFRQYSPDGVLVSEYIQLSDASRAIGKSSQAIKACMNDRSRRCGGFIWFHSSQDEFKN